MNPELDDVIAATAADMAAKHPRRGRSAGQSFEESVKRISRDRDVADRNELRARGPLSYRDGSGPSVILPPGAGRKPTRKD